MSLPEIAAARLDAILTLREEYRREMNCQIVHDSWHARGFTDSYLFSFAGQPVGYGSVGGAPREPRTTVKEFFLRPPYREHAGPLFRRFLSRSGAQAIEAQTNDPLLFPLLSDHALEVTSDTYLFSEGVVTRLEAPGATFRRMTVFDRLRMFKHTVEPVGDWGLEVDGRVVATGGLLYHYNPPYGDVYMEVAEPFRQRGFGSYLVQEVKRVCREGGHVPAARCGTENAGSRLTLQRAGMSLCGRIVSGRVGRED